MVKLERIAYLPDATFGRLWVNVRMWFTIEPPWLANAKGNSCVPIGKYRMVWEWSPRFGRNLWELKGVPGRSEIKIHPANYASQLEGCIAPGKAIGVIAGRLGVASSVKALDEVHEAIDKLLDDLNEAEIEIVNYIGGVL